MSTKNEMDNEAINSFSSVMYLIFRVSNRSCPCRFRVAVDKIRDAEKSLLEIARRTDIASVSSHDGGSVDLDVATFLIETMYSGAWRAIMAGRVLSQSTSLSEVLSSSLRKSPLSPASPSSEEVIIHIVLEGECSSPYPVSPSPSPNVSDSISAPSRPVDISSESTVHNSSPSTLSSPIIGFDSSASSEDFNVASIASALQLPPLPDDATDAQRKEYICWVREYAAWAASNPQTPQLPSSDSSSERMSAPISSPFENTHPVAEQNQEDPIVENRDEVEIEQPVPAANDRARPGWFIVVMRLVFLFLIFGQDGGFMRYFLLFMIVVIVLLARYGFFPCLRPRVAEQPLRQPTEYYRPRTFFSRLSYGMYLTCVSLLPWWKPDPPPPLMTKSSESELTQATESAVLPQDENSGAISRGGDYVDDSGHLESDEEELPRHRNIASSST